MGLHQQVVDTTYYFFLNDRLVFLLIRLQTITIHSLELPLCSFIFLCKAWNVFLRNISKPVRQDPSGVNLCYSPLTSLTTKLATFRLNLTFVSLHTITHHPPLLVISLVFWSLWPVSPKSLISEFLN